MQIVTYDAKVGKLYIARKNNILLAISYSPFKDDYLKKLTSESSIKISGNDANTLIDQLNAYFSGKNFGFSVQMELRGSEFQKKVWLACAKIPYGKTRSYAELAKAIGNPKATRAVGTALGNNPISIIIPCHRVLRSNGEMGGYAGGLDVKRKLLALEQENN
ncbi:MAG: methylated-DNA--[protein]-cysteine S-methyltransferase [Candidatus Neomarinimicrobiota bacterium]|jgi:methylated-DNA-[protein]-cysteine S-methyltransferase